MLWRIIVQIDGADDMAYTVISSSLSGAMSKCIRVYTTLEQKTEWSECVFTVKPAREGVIDES